MCVCVCVCVGSMCLKFIVERYFWEFKMLFGSLVELHALLHSYRCFSLLEKLFLSNLDRSSTTGWINRESSWTFDSFSTTDGSIELLLLCLCFLPRHLLDSCICRRCFYWHLSRQMARHLYLSRITKVLYKGQAWSGSYFSQSLSHQKCLFTSQTSLTHSKSFSQVIFKLFQVLSSLGMFLFSHLHAFSCFET